MVHDSDIAATLMNRWEMAGESRESTLELLNEGQLQFTSERGVFAKNESSFGHPVEFECLLFEDGSRVLRLVDSVTARSLTPWCSVAPATAASPQTDNGSAARGTYGRPPTDGSRVLSD